METDECVKRLIQILDPAETEIKTEVKEQTTPIVSNCGNNCVVIGHISNIEIQISIKRRYKRDS